MGKHEGVDAFPLSWPQGWPRTRTQERSRFTQTVASARDALFREVALMGGADIVLSSNLALRLDGLPRSGQPQPADKGVAVYFYRRGRQMSFACDRWDAVEDNIHAIVKTIEAIRGIERWGASEMMERAFTAFERLAAPPTCWNVLGLRPNASRAEIDAAYRAKARKAHPDAGGSDAAMAALNRARDDAYASIAS